MQNFLSTANKALYDYVKSHHLAYARHDINHLTQLQSRLAAALVKHQKTVAAIRSIIRETMHQSSALA